jgi:hypothetical protein
MRSLGLPIPSEAGVPGSQMLEQKRWYGYSMSLASAVIRSHSEHGRHISSTLGRGLRRTEAITYHQRYLLESGDWTQSEYDAAERLRARLDNLQIIKQGKTDSFSMEIDQSVLKICYSTFDPDTYKRTEHCEPIDLADYWQ